MEQKNNLDDFWVCSDLCAQLDDTLVRNMSDISLAVTALNMGNVYATQFA